jgi:hypothetical protein
MPMEKEVPRHVWVPQLAKRIIREHWADGRCEKCQGSGCDSLAWAHDRLKAYRMAGNRPDRYGARGTEHPVACECGCGSVGLCRTPKVPAPRPRPRVDWSRDVPRSR